MKSACSFSFCSDQTASRGGPQALFFGFSACFEIFAAAGTIRLAIGLIGLAFKPHCEQERSVLSTPTLP